MPIDPLSAFDPLDGAPESIVFATFNFRRQVFEWFEAEARVGCNYWCFQFVDDGSPSGMLRKPLGVSQLVVLGRGPRLGHRARLENTCRCLLEQEAAGRRSR